jgi:hypothetical protein
MLVNHTGWAYLDYMPTSEQLEVITTYRDESLTGKYIVVVFEKNKMRERHFKRCEELGLNKENNKNYELMDNGEYIDHSDYSPRTEEMED